MGVRPGPRAAGRARRSVVVALAAACAAVAGWAAVDGDTDPGTVVQLGLAAANMAGRVLTPPPGGGTGGRRPCLCSGHGNDDTAGGGVAMGTERRIEYRPAEPGDRAQIEAIDDAFTTDTVYEVVADGHAFVLRPTAVDPPLVKTFPADDGDGEDLLAPGRHVEVAVADGTVCGFVAAGVEEWNRRLVVHEIAVAPGHRGQGIGGALLRRALAHGRRHGARTAWLEVTNVNVPAIRAYQRLGFALCGLDTTHYRGTPSEGETALFMSKPLDTTIDI
ncbi:hypothetical protein GCM10010218_56200 [Streptomyces mashuensis]|uniref:N-acetyltransferase domain-containing protein n=2 Tax=Streptomyces mashuensis TaxID=33904 RepID=A0A919B7M6_9ACTN|nr:hypothetical protein GCM10010218_56200 [Streptomyces mashuensis]